VICRSIVPATFTTLLLMLSTAHAADTKASCVEANGAAQALRIQGKLGAARSLLVECAAPSCPDLVRNDCAQRFLELERAQPTIVLDVKDARGADVTGVSLTIDGDALPETLQGRAVPVDPGQHELVFTSPGFAPAKRLFVMKEGEKGRRERIILEPASLESPVGSHGADVGPPPPDVSTPAAASPPLAAVEEAGSLNASDSADAKKDSKPDLRRTLAFATGGAGLAGIAAGTVFGLLTFSSVAAQKSDCGPGPYCGNRGQALSDHATAVTDSTISTASFIVGGALFVTGATLFTASSSGRSRSSAGLAVTPSVGTRGAGLSVRAEF
jgi:hypothetical protein